MDPPPPPPHDDSRVIRGRLVSVSSTKEERGVGGRRMIDPPDRCSILIYALINNDPPPRLRAILSRESMHAGAIR